jgi:hypothetical protein
MGLSEMAYMSIATKLYYLNLLGRLMLRPLLVTLGRDTSVAFKPTSSPPTPDAPPPRCLIACFLGGLFDTSLEACFLFSRGCGASLVSSLSPPLSHLLGPLFHLLQLPLFVCLPLVSCYLLQGKFFSLAACLAAFKLAFFGQFFLLFFVLLCQSLKSLFNC